MTAKPTFSWRTNDGDMLLYPFKDGSFYKGGGPIKVGNGWSFTNYFLADWDGGRRSRSSRAHRRRRYAALSVQERLVLQRRRSIKVGNGWNFADYIVGDFNGDGIPDLMVRTASGDMHFYPFHNGTFY